MTPVPHNNPQSHFIDLQELGSKLLTPRPIVRDKDGYLAHPDLPVFDESVRIDLFLAAFGIEPAFVSMEFDCPDDPRVEAFFEHDTSFAWWNPTPPEGEGWLLLEIYVTEDGPAAMFIRENIAPPPVSRRAQRAAEAAALAAEFEARDKARAGWRVAPVDNPQDEEQMLLARASWEVYDRMQAGDDANGTGGWFYTGKEATEVA
jgi:hypothetical protein